MKAEKKNNEEEGMKLFLHVEICKSEYGGFDIRIGDIASGEYNDYELNEDEILELIKDQLKKLKEVECLIQKV